MKPALTKVINPVWHLVDGKRVEGAHSSIRGSVSGIWGDVSDIWGDVSDIQGSVSGIRGDVSGIWGDLDDCELSQGDREAGVDINRLIGAA